MSYTPTTWVTGDTVTATKLNKIEQGIASSGGGAAVVHLSVLGFPTTSIAYGYIVYATYDNNSSKWVVSDDTTEHWYLILGFADNAPSIFPLYATVLPSDDSVGLFFVSDYEQISVTGDINQAGLYYSYGSPTGNAYRITGNGSISIVYS